MTPEREQEIRDAAARAERARMAFQASLAMNVPQDYEKRIEAAQAHALKQAELAEAERNLRRVISA